MVLQWESPMTENKPGRAHLKIAISAAALIAAMVLTMQLISHARQLQVLKTDLAEVNHIRYGLLNTDEWAYQMSTILSIKIVEFKLTPESRERVLHNLESVLNMMIDEVELMMIKRTSGSLSGMKRFFAGFAINFDQLRDSVPNYANTLLLEISNPENKEFMQQFLLDKLGEITASTYNLDQMDPLHTVMEKHNCRDKDSCKELIEEEIDMKQEIINYRGLLVIVLVTAVFLINTRASTPIISPFRTSMGFISGIENDPSALL